MLSFEFIVFSFFIIVCCVYEGMSFITFVQVSLYPKGNNASKDEGFYRLTFSVLPCSWLIAFKNKSPTHTDSDIRSISSGLSTDLVNPGNAESLAKSLLLVRS
jgi:hypothetical protein